MLYIKSVHCQFVEVCFCAVISKLQTHPNLHSPVVGWKRGCPQRGGTSLGAYIASHYPGLLMTGLCTPSLGTTAFDPTQTGLCKFGRGFGARWSYFLSRTILVLEAYLSAGFQALEHRNSWPISMPCLSFASCGAVPMRWTPPQPPTRKKWLLCSLKSKWPTAARQVTMQLRHPLYRDTFPRDNLKCDTKVSQNHYCFAAKWPRMLKMRREHFHCVRIGTVRVVKRKTIRIKFLSSSCPFIGSIMPPKIDFRQKGISPDLCATWLSRGKLVPFLGIFCLFSWFGGKKGQEKKPRSTLVCA